MLDKLNAIAKMVQDAISSHPDNKKAKPANDPDGDGDNDAGESAASKAQKSIRKNMGGSKEPC